ncbi:MAG: LapA family protein [Stellaceae bacterium]
MSTEQAPPPVDPAPEPPAAGEPAPREPSNWQPLLWIRLGLLLAAIAYSIAFVAENTRQIRVHFVFATASVHLIWEILLLLAVGMAAGIVASQLYRHRRRAQLAKKSGKAGHARPDRRG